jgi:hypothetical protein
MSPLIARLIWGMDPRIIAKSPRRTPSWPRHARAPHARCEAHDPHYAPLAQLDRALASGAKGQRFESSRARQSIRSQSGSAAKGSTLRFALQPPPPQEFLKKTLKVFHGIPRTGGRAPSRPAPRASRSTDPPRSAGHGDVRVRAAGAPRCPSRARAISSNAPGRNATKGRGRKAPRPTRDQGPR